MPVDPFAEATPEDLAVANELGHKPTALELLHAHVRATGGQKRPQQDLMLEAVAEAIENAEPLLVQAGTGTGKSLAYAFAAAASGKRTVIATATNQLGEQLASKDLPMVADLLGQIGTDLPVALLKGRANYVCKLKVRRGVEMEEDAPQEALFETEQDSLSGQAAEAAALYKWANKTSTGDRTEAPAVSNRVWRQVSVSGAECAGSDCPFFDSCFTEIARRQARAARIVLTNHSLLAQDIRMRLAPDEDGNGQSLLGPAPVVIVDEAHAFAAAVTDALSTVVDAQEARTVIQKADLYVVDDRPEGGGSKSMSRSVEQALQALDGLTEAMTVIPPGPLADLPIELEDALVEMARACTHVAQRLQAAASKATTDGKPNRALAASMLQEQVAEIGSTALNARAERAGTVRWIEEVNEKRRLCVAPIEVGDAVTEWAEKGQHTLIATSATLTVGNSFESIARTLGLPQARALDVGTPFNYRKLGYLYVPQAPFPEPVGRDRREHSEQVLVEATRLVAAAGGRALLLSTTTAGALRMAEHLRKEFPGLTVLAHGDAPADVLVSQFRDEETSVLCATMGLWHGVDVPGPSCSLVVIDKIPFAPMDDALTSARRAAADSAGRNGFTEVFVADAAIDLAQAAGRLVRRPTDKGVVAILDPRLHSKGYGRLLLDSLPDLNRVADGDRMCTSLEGLTGGLDPEARRKPAKPRKPRTASGAPKRARGPRKAPARRRRQA